MYINLEYIDVLVVASLGLALRGIISLGPYSGKSTPPMFGDYEAQRHWQEITNNLPPKEWYRNSTKNDLMYWGLDYPPLTAYHSYIVGHIAHSINSSYVSLFKSRGCESEDHQSFMRLTVLVADAFVYMPASVFLSYSLKKSCNLNSHFPILTMLLMYPGLILIDNGHFQYNNISLGLALAAVAAILLNSYVSGALFFSLALNYKQMELYHALPFFVYLLKISLCENTVFQKLLKLSQIAFVTLLTFILLWLPWIGSMDSFLSTLQRLFPFSRGVFEDKVANVWCSLNVVYKFKENFNNSQMAIICLATTLLAILPINLHTFLKCTRKSFLFSLFNTALAFFLFSFQVHEKSILLAALPAICLFHFMPFYTVSFLKLSLLSMFPLFIKDQLVIQYFIMYIGFVLSIKYLININYSSDRNVNYVLCILMNALDACILLISLAAKYLPSPSHLPHIWPLFISVFCCIGFLLILVISIIYQFNYELYLNRIFYKFIIAKRK